MIIHQTFDLQFIGYATRQLIGWGLVTCECDRFTVSATKRSTMRIVTARPISRLHFLCEKVKLGTGAYENIYEKTIAVTTTTLTIDN